MLEPTRDLELTRLPRCALEPSQNASPPLGRAHSARVFAVDVLTCPDCGGALRLIATITEGLVVRRILDHLELPSSPPPIDPARAPPELEFAG